MPPAETDGDRLRASNQGRRPNRKRKTESFFGLFGERPKVFSLTEMAEMFSSKSLAESTFDLSLALSLAAASKFAYESGSVISPFGIGGFGFESCKFIEADETQCFIASTAESILISFRGTESLGDWLLNLRVLTTQRPYGKVHTGFLRGFEFVQMQLESELGKLPENRNVLITGHSLGGALATIAAVEWFHRFDVSAVYTFGQPAVGTAQFAEFMNKNYADKFFRFVNNSDIVTRVPPTYSHVGELKHFDRAGKFKLPVEQFGKSSTMTVAEFFEFQETLIQTTNSDGSELEAIEESIFTSTSDHAMDRYIEKILKMTS